MDRELTSQLVPKQISRNINQDRSISAKNFPVGIFQTDENGNCVYVNEKWCELSGLLPEEAIGKDWAKALYPNNCERVFIVSYHTSEEEGEFALEYRIVNHDGTSKWIFANAIAIRSSHGKIKGYVGTTTNITKIKQTEEKLLESEWRYRQLVDNSSGLICTHDLDGFLLSANPAGFRALGYKSEELIGRHISEFIVPDKREQFNNYLKGFKESLMYNGLLEVVTKSGETLVWSFRNVLCQEAGEPAYVLCHAHDVTDIKRSEQTSLDLAERDALTRLLNRRGFINQAEQQLGLLQTQQTNKHLLLIYSDLDNLKLINDNFGHNEGDEAICAISKTLKDSFRTSDIIARLGGDEFAVLATVSKKDRKKLILRRIQKGIESYNKKSKNPYEISQSVGIITITSDNTNCIEELLDQADHIMYQEKQRKKALLQNA